MLKLFQFLDKQRLEKKGTDQRPICSVMHLQPWCVVGPAEAAGKW